MSSVLVTKSCLLVLQGSFSRTGRLNVKDFSAAEHFQYGGTGTCERRALIGAMKLAGGKVFVCYRREDSAGHAGRLYDRLNQRFPGRVFMDVAGLGVGDRWAEVIEQTLGSCEVAVILIGRRWLERGPDGTRRIDAPDDPLRAEIITALRLRLKIVPLLVGGAAVPQDEDLPRDVAPIVDWQALRVDDDDFDHDSSRLIQALERQLQDEETAPLLESAEAKSTEVRRLLESAESCIARSDWVTAAQILQSVLSLDKTNADAAARLRFVQQQSTRATRAYSREMPVQLPPKGRAGRRVAFGALGILGGIGALTVLVILVAVLAGNVGPGNGPPLDGRTDTGMPVSASDEVYDADPPESTEAPAPQTPAAPQMAGAQMAGDYQLDSYSQGDVTAPLSGAMRLSPDGDGRFQFEIYAQNHAMGTAFEYRGFLQGQGTNWMSQTVQTNDPTALTIPIPLQLRFDGSTLVTQSGYGETVVWQKQ